jgi:predicted HD phosphohydrolase
MAAAEAGEFEAEPFSEDALALRSFVEGGMVAGLDIPVLEAWRPLLDSPEFRL